MLTTSRAGCCGSGPLLLFFATSWSESLPAFGFNSFAPLRCSCPISNQVSVPPQVRRRKPLESKVRTDCLLLSAASSAACRGLTGMLSSPPPPLLPRVRVAPITLCPPPTVPGFEQITPIRVGDQGKKVNNVDPSHRSCPMIHPILPPNSAASYVLFMSSRRSL